VYNTLPNFQSANSYVKILWIGVLDRGKLKLKWPPVLYMPWEHNSSSSSSFFILFCFLRQSLITMYSGLAWNFLYSVGWPQTCDPPVSSFLSVEIIGVDYHARLWEHTPTGPAAIPGIRPMFLYLTQSDWENLKYWSRETHSVKFNVY
jgi:hypothetical protein